MEHNRTRLLKPLPRHFVIAMMKHWDALQFLQKHKLWNGVFRYGWITKALILVAILIGLQYLALFADWIGGVSNRGFNSSSLLTLGSSSFDFWKDNVSWLFSGGNKYIILILTEVITFHMVRSTFAILTGSEQDKSFKTFFDAQIRMIKVAAFSWGMEIGIGFGMGALLGIFGLSDVKESLMFVVECFFLGFALIDNYNEQYGMKVKESYKRTLSVVGASLALGLVFYVLLYIPIVGAIIAPCIGGVAAAITMLSFETSGDLMPYVPVVEEAE
ncbi:MAG: hypothetical protein AAGI49_19785 [Bacteroidota bacterium]